MTAFALFNEAPPYPPRTAQDETSRLLCVHPEALDVLNHYGFGGTEDFTRPFRILALDEGSGDSVIFLAEQLRGHPATLVYLSPSQSALDLVKARAAQRTLTNIEWALHALTDLPALDLGQFDYISCNIALDRVAAPEQTLALLQGALTENGTCLCMVEGYYGRTGQRQMRDLVTLISGEHADPEVKLHDAHAALRVLPATNWYIRTKNLFERDITQYGNQAVARLFIDTPQQHYTVPALYELIEKQNLHLQDFVTLEGDANVRYVPEVTLTSPKLQPYLQGLARPDRQAAAEILYGTLTSHYCYISRKPKPCISPKNTELVPFYAAHFTFENVSGAIANHLQHTPDPVIGQQHTGHSIRIERSQNTVALCHAMDGKRSIAEIIALVLATPNLPAETTEASLLKEFTALYETFHRYDWMLLRTKQVTDFATLDVLQARIQ